MSTPSGPIADGALRPRSRRRAWAAGLLVLCGLGLVVLRLFTCVLVLSDDPTTYLALKRHPSTRTTVRIGDEPVRRDYILLDDDENQLVYEGAYLALVDHAAIAAAGCVAAGLSILLWRRREPPGR